MFTSIAEAHKHLNPAIPLTNVHLNPYALIIKQHEIQSFHGLAYTLL